MSKARVAVQCTVLFFLALVVYLNQYENFKKMYGGDSIIKNSYMLSTIDKAIGMMDNRSDLTTSVQGSLWAMKVGPYKIVDPLAFVVNAVRTKKIYWPLFLAVVVPIVATLLLGKVFCGWICPMGLFERINDWLRKLLLKIGVPLLQIRVPRAAKHLVLVAGLVACLIWGGHYFVLVYPPKLISDELVGFFTTSTLTFASLVVASILFMELLLGRRIWCASLCPGGSLYGILSGARILRVRNDMNKCVSCGICDKVCPLLLTPSKGNIPIDCDQCADCIDKCPDRALSFSYKR